MRYQSNESGGLLHKNVGQYPHDRILLSEKNMKNVPFYGLTLVPDFLKPFLGQLEFEVKALNTYLYQYLYETLDLHPREDFWILEAYTAI